MTEVLHNPVTGEIIESKPNLSQPIHPSPMPDLAPAPVPADETKRAKFERLAEQRFGNVVKALHVLRKLGRNQSDYEYDDEDVDLIREKIFAEVDAACGELKRRGKPVQTKLFG
jgi:predicted secreted protein